MDEKTVFKTFFKMCQIRPLFRSFHDAKTYIAQCHVTINDKSVDGVLGT